jgi:hypothetical protein
MLHRLKNIIVSHPGPGLAGSLFASLGPNLIETTCGRLGIEVNQYNNPIEVYSDDTIEDMREEKVILDHPEVADKIIKSNAKKHTENPIATQKKMVDKFDPKRSSVLMAINATEGV